MPKGDFVLEVNKLLSRVGSGDLVGGVSFEGPHALVHHEFPSEHDPPSWEGLNALVYTQPGTGPGYLRIPMMQNHPKYLQDVADELIDGDPRAAMYKAMNRLKDDAVERTPKESGDLAESARAWVRHR